MRTAFDLSQSNDQHGAASPTDRPIAPRERVLQIACGLFAEAGFHGTHLREVCRRAGANVAEVYYYFQSKERLYEAVIMEAGRRLLAQNGNLQASRRLPPEERLLKLVESLLQRLSAEGAWIAKVLAREWVDPTCGAHNYAASGLERDFVLLQAVMRDLLGAKADTEAIRLYALSLIGECVFYCLAGENLQHPLTQLAVGLPSLPRLARFLTQRSLRILEPERTVLVRDR